MSRIITWTTSECKYLQQHKKNKPFIKIDIYLKNIHALHSGKRVAKYDTMWKITTTSVQ